jgi:hypothetical protein
MLIGGFFLMLTQSGDNAEAEYRDVIPNEYMGEPLPSTLTDAEGNGFKLACNTYMGSMFQARIRSLSLAFVILL